MTATAAEPLTPSQARRQRILRLEELVAAARRELVGLYRLEGYQPRPRVPTKGIHHQPEPARRPADRGADDQSAAEVPGKIINAWAIREGIRAPGTRGQVPESVRRAYWDAGHPGWPPPKPTGATDTIVRAWCRLEGVPVNDHGSVSKEARAAYDRAHPTTT